MRLYGLRQWVEQSYKQTKYALGWHEYQVRSDRAIRRHWAWSAVPSPSVGTSRVSSARRSTPAADRDRLTSQPPLQAPPRPREAGRGENQRGAGSGAALLCWPVALRAVRAWLEPWIMLWRYWRGWSSAPPPPALQRLLDWLWQGHGIDLYVPR